MNNDKPNFFSSVAKYNHERFHSEVISWCFNFNKEFAKNFIKKITGIELDKTPDQIAKSEENSIDIILNFEHSNQNYSIFIENKVKATEHIINIKNKKNIIESEEIILLRKNKMFELSQTEFYYTQNKKERFHYFVYLKPCIIDENSDNAPEYVETKEYNNWCNLSNLNIENPWKTIAYFELAECMKPVLNNNEAEAIIYNSYYQFISNEKYFPTNALKIQDLSFTEINNEPNDLEENFKTKYINYEYFKILSHKLKEMFSKIPKDILTHEVKSDSSNSSEPMLIISKKIKTPDEIKPYFEKTAFNEFLSIGIQLQGNSLKFFIEAFDYKNATIKKDKKKDFSDFCHVKITKHLPLEMRNNKKTYSKGKTFNTLSEVIELESIADTTKSIFSKIEFYIKSIVAL
ncbi:MAG: PD-(D/E)XK nuclease family protein [Chitinophagaceae bacterium]|nr:PD-(D/E)XK nuclease family protein [Chitinophagaceae bacterium]